MKLNFVLVTVIFLSFGVTVYGYAYQSGHSVGLSEGVAARTAITTDPARQGAGGFGGANGQTNNGTPAASGGNANSVQRGLARLLTGYNGTVDKVDGNTLTVSVVRGQQTQSVKVTLADGATVEQLTGGALSDIKPGSRVLIGTDTPQGGFGGQGQGQQALPTELTARTLTIIPANFGQ
ncbi:MAG: hypothetical protein HZB53_04510 [Chloroflexi bacterium]|nr:hypothetical protein [Chloroflexota bacterium]